MDLGGFRGSLGVSRGVKGGLLDPYRTLFAPLEVLFGTGFGSKQHIMAQLAYVNRVGITDPLLDLWSPPKGSQRAIIWANKVLVEPKKLPKMPFRGSKLLFNCGDHPDGAFWTKSCHLGPSNYLFRGQKARFRSIWGFKRALFADEMAFWESLGGFQRSRSGSVIPTLL